MTVTTTDAGTDGLRRELGLLDATMINVGTIIGSSLFLLPASIAAALFRSRPTPLPRAAWDRGGVFRLVPHHSRLGGGSTGLAVRRALHRRAGSGDAEGGWTVRLPAACLRTALGIPLRLGCGGGDQSGFDCLRERGFCDLPRLLRAALRARRQAGGGGRHSPAHALQQIGRASCRE